MNKSCRTIKNNSKGQSKKKICSQVVQENYELIGEALGKLWGGSGETLGGSGEALGRLWGGFRGLLGSFWGALGRLWHA